MLLDEIATYIASAGFGVVGTNLFKGQMPATPVNCITLYEVAHRPTATTLDLPIAHEFPELRVVVRHTSQVAARARCEMIMRALANIKNTFLSGTFYLTVTPLSTPFNVQSDENKNFHIACRFEVMKVASSDVPTVTF